MVTQGQTLNSFAGCLAHFVALTCARLQGEARQQKFPRGEKRKIHLKEDWQCHALISKHESQVGGNQMSRI